jgi:hypothetical protein
VMVTGNFRYKSPTFRSMICSNNWSRGTIKAATDVGGLEVLQAWLPYLAVHEVIKVLHLLLQQVLLLIPEVVVGLRHL